METNVGVCWLVCYDAVFHTDNEMCVDVLYIKYLLYMLLCYWFLMLHIINKESHS